MSEAILEGAGSLRKNKHFVTKMPFPMGTIMTYTVLSHLYVHIALTAIGYIIIIFFGVMPSIYNIQLLFYMPMMFLFFTFLSWVTSPLSAVSKDFEHIVKAVITAIFWLSGIIWNPYTMKDGIIKRIVLANPINFFANGYRNTFLYKKWFWESRYELIVFLIMLTGMFFLGSFVYKRLKKTIPDIL